MVDTIRPLPDLRRTAALLAALVIVSAFALLYVQRAAAQDAEPLFACIPDTAQVSAASIQMRGADGKRANIRLDAEDIEALWALEGESIWIGYENGGWAYPADMAEMTFASYWVFGKYGGEKFWVTLYVADEYALGFVYDNTDPFADSNGEHMGYHPCGGWQLDVDSVMAVIEKLGE